MKSMRTLVALALAASFASGSFAASESAPALITVPKNEAAIQENKAITARDAANNPAKPTSRKTKATPAGHQTKAKPVKGTSAKKPKSKTPQHARATK